MPSRRTAALIGLLLVMEVLSGFVLLVGSSLLEATSWGYALFWLLVPIALGGAAVGLVTNGRGWRERRQRAALVGTGAVLAGVPSFLIANGVVTFLASFLLLGLAFWRGLAVAAEPPNYDEVQRRVAFGFGILFFGILWVIARGIIAQPQIWHMLAAAGIGFIVVCMLALVTARVAQVREPGAGGAIALAVAIQLGLLLLLSVLGLQLFALDLAGLLGHTVQPFFDALGRDLYGLVGYLADPIDRFLQLIRPHAKPGAPLTPPTQGSSAFNGKRPKYHPPLHSPLVVLFTLILVALMAAAIGYGIWRAVPRARTRPTVKKSYVEERRSLVSMSTVWHTLLSSLLALFRRGSRRTADTLAAGRRRVWGPEYPADPVRRIYAQLLRRSASLGLGRPATATPLEFQDRLVARWPDASHAFELLTSAYVHRRYGELQPAGEELSALRAAWHRVKQVARGPNRVEARLESGRASLAAMMKAPEHEHPRRPFPRAERATRWTEAERVAWRPTGTLLMVLSFSLPALVILVFLLILLVASGRLG